MSYLAGLSIALDSYAQHHLASVGEITGSWPELCKSPTCPMHHQARQSAVKSSICGSFNLISFQSSPGVKWRVMSIARRILNCELVTYACALIIITIAVVYGRYFSKTSSFAPTTAFASIKRKMYSTISPKILGLRPLTAIPVGGATTLCHRGRRTLA